MTQMDRAPWLRDRFEGEYAGKYKHQIGVASGNVYRAVRQRMGLSQTAMAERLGLKLTGYQYRERQKTMYYPLELAVLHDLSQLPPDEFINILYDIA